MKTGISTACLYPLETEKALESLLPLGFKTFEIFANTDSELAIPYLNQIKIKLDNYGASLYSLHLFSAAYEPVMFFSNYPRRFADSISLYSRYFAGAAKIGARIAVFHGDRRESKMNIEEYCERFFFVSKAAKNEGITLAQENVSRCKSAHVADIKNMRRCMGEGQIKFVLDIKQAIRANENPLDMLDAMGSDIVNVHISDHSPQHDCLLPGFGNMDYNQLISKLEEYHYPGPLIIEVYGNNFRSETELIKAKEFMDNY